MTKTKIEWSHSVWNPIAGCTVISSGCDNCYAMQQAYRLEKMHVDKYNGTAHKNASGRALWTGKINFDEKALLKPLSWKKPRMIFVNSMSDLFHENVPDEWIDKVFAIMALCPQHTFQILTKRPERMRDYMHSIDDNEGGRLAGMRSAMIEGNAQKIYAERTGEEPEMWLSVHLPLDNVWLGVSVEDQTTADERIPYLLDTPAAVRFISAEPLLGEIDLTRVWARMPSGGKSLWNTLSNLVWKDGDYAEHLGSKLDWVIVGGESGPNARPMHPEWARSLRDQCKAANVPFFFKQNGEWASAVHHPDKGRFPCKNWWNDKWEDSQYPCWSDEKDYGADNWVYRFGKKKTGHLLDGEVIQQMPGDA